MDLCIETLLDFHLLRYLHYLFGFHEDCLLYARHLLTSNTAYTEKDAFARQASFEKQSQDSQSGNYSLICRPTS